MAAIERRRAREKQEISEETGKDGGFSANNNVATKPRYRRDKIARCLPIGEQSESKCQQSIRRTPRNPRLLTGSCGNNAQRVLILSASHKVLLGRYTDVLFSAQHDAVLLEVVRIVHDFAGDCSYLVLGDLRIVVVVIWFLGERGREKRKFSLQISNLKFNKLI